MLPQVPVRQWLLTMLCRLRYRMAWNHGPSREVLSGYARVLVDVYGRGARPRGVEGGQTGRVTALQRAGRALNENLHFDTLVLDGVFIEDPEAALASLGYCVRTATLVEPRVTLPPSLNRTKIRFIAGSNGTLPVP